ncbi:MAG: hypothetical protein R6V35_00695 [Candidatus Nanohaloarchaea archaeon]
MSNIREKDIYRACIVLSIIGLGVIHISHSYIQPDKVGIDQIDETWMGNTVQISGNVRDHFQTGNAAFFTLENSSHTISVADFESRNISDQVTVTGHVDIYQGDLQIVAQKIE